jgi:deoxyribodipyrimidine photo-lyase
VSTIPGPATVFTALSSTAWQTMRAPVTRSARAIIRMLSPFQAPAKDFSLLLHAWVVVTDDFPCFFLPRMIVNAAKKLPVLLAAVDSNGLLPIRATDHAALRAVDFRRFLQKALPAHLLHFPQPEPLANAKLPPAPSVPREITSHWPLALKSLLEDEPGSLNALPIDHSVKPAPVRGGHASAHAHLLDFFNKKFALYAGQRNHPNHDVSSGFSPFLHFGHLSVHEVFSELARREKWKPAKLSLRTNGSREGWWNMSPSAESFLDQLITWRELGYNFCFHRPDYDTFSSLPAWARKILQDRGKDHRDPVYTVQQFESADTHDALWNAAQVQLLREGRIHNYPRMLWGKKILQWSRSPEDAARIMMHLNNKYGLDGRDANPYSGIFWVFGRYDRPWAPVRPVFGSVRYMSSENAARKLSLKNYLRTYARGSPAQTELEF